METQNLIANFCMCLEVCEHVAMHINVARHV